VTIGTVYMIDFEGVEDVILLQDPERLSRLLRTCAEAAEVQIVEEPLVHVFDSQGEGLTYLALLAQSHLAAHTWPEFRFLSVDFYTCGDADKARMALEALQLCIPCRSVSLTVSTRGTSDAREHQCLAQVCVR
jgi:S-adenosylmethionine decarboxylase proenzyme